MKIILFITLLIGLSACAPSGTRYKDTSFKIGPACFENEQGEGFCTSNNEIKRFY
jgi:hypothetical protein